MHLVAGLPPMYRIHTVMQRAETMPVLTVQQVEQFVTEMIGEDRLAELRKLRNMDFSSQIDDVARFRVNAHFQRSTIGLSFRLISEHIPTLEELYLPPITKTLVDVPQGLILITGQAGDGKSTTLAALIEAMNQKHPYHIITVEDPIEYLFSSKKSLVEQRELGRDVLSFAEGARDALRQDPDVIMVGEMRDAATIKATMSAAETGHLVLASMHAANGPQAVERIIDVYRAEEQGLIRTVLANNLHAVLGQILFKRIDKEGLIPACSMMICTPGVRNCIREDRVHEILSIMQTGRSEGMCLFEDAILDLYRNGRVDEGQALTHVSRLPGLKRALSA